MKALEDLPAYWMNLKLPDLLAIIYIIIMVFVTLASNVIFASYLDSKPAGRKTVIGNIKYLIGNLLSSKNITAQVNLATCRVMSSCALSLYLPVLLRIFFGPFSYGGVVAYHYTTRVCIVSFLTMITFNKVLKTLFILDFERMTAVSEKKVMIWMGVVTSIGTLTHLVEEAVTRRIRGLDQFARLCTNVYLGKVVW